MPNAPFISHTERLVAFCELDGDRGFSGIIETPTQAAELIKNQTEDCFKIVRYDMETDTAEDVTEDVAAAYLALYGANLDEDSKIDAFLEASEAWEEHLDYLAQEAIEEARYGSYVEQNRLAPHQLV